MIGILELAVITVVCLGAGLLPSLMLSQDGMVAVVPTITAIALVLIPALLAHALTLGGCRTSPATVSLWALAGTGIRLILTLGGAAVVLLTVSWGSALSFWMPLMASYLAVLLTELLFSLRRIAPPQ
ncbi:MAG: hypothetical protein RMJ19_14090 [Gemmatales bacterium]|nr:hypothetical protein [Gemmatales bacterium]MCS7161600.1 hypothetical protein [Gemmatales bacterium]MDW8176803.1 hypothetical protein [Gemmatales bacterium]MDW8221776.1 hypothetical protein [Gemmatales bacterium]